VPEGGRDLSVSTVFQEDQHTLHQEAGGRLVVIGDAAVGEEMPVARVQKQLRARNCVREIAGRGFVLL
jgi:hypothetical protein